jgi:thiamine biosynthesis lipoprotein
MVKGFFVLLLIGAAGMWFMGVRGGGPEMRWTVTMGRAMGTTYTIKAKVPGAGLAEDPVALAAGEVHRIEQLMSHWISTSEVSRFNASQSTAWFEVSRETAVVVAEAVRVSEMTGGAFDVTAGPLVRLWGFGPEAAVGEPTAEQIAAAKAHVGSHLLEVRLDPPAIRKRDAQVSIDLSAIAKGYAVDAAAEALERWTGDYMVEVGGEVRARGMARDGGPWSIGIDEPGAAERRVATTVRLQGGAVATSGDYRQFRTGSAGRISHLIDPRTGGPAAGFGEGAAASVTVMDGSCMRADALATALFVMGEAGWEMAERENLAVMFIVRDRDGKMLIRTTQVMTDAVAPPGPHR